MAEPELDGRRSLRVGVIGAGMAGILAVIKLREAGITDIVCFEKADRVGGTWRENTYPGIACDVPSHVYSYSFAPNPDFTRMFSPGDEIQGYLEQVVVDFGVGPHLRLGDEVVSAVYDGGTWRLETARGHRADFDVVIAATGVLHHPRVPEIDGLDDFQGAMFHSARWDHDVPLDGRRVGVIGTGSTAVQISSVLVDRVEQLCLFQRTPQWIMPMDNKPFADDQRAAFRDEPHRLEELRDFLESAFAENFADAVVDATVRASGTDRASVPGQPLRARHRPRTAPSAGARLPRRMQTPGRVGRLLRRDPAAKRRTRHRAHCTRRSGAVSEPRWAISTSSMCSCSRPGSRSTDSCGPP